MKLKEVQIKDFRSIKNITVKFEHNCLVLVGINEAGKSNILKALSLLGKNNKLEPVDERIPAPDETKEIETDIRFMFDVKSSDQEAICKWIYTGKNSNQNMDLMKKKDEVYSVQKYINIWEEYLYRITIKKPEGYIGYYSYCSEDFELTGKWYIVTSECPEDYDFVNREMNVGITLSDYALIYEDYIEEIPSNYIKEATTQEAITAIHKKFESRFNDYKYYDIIYWKYSDSMLLLETVDLAEFMNNPEYYRPLQNMFALAGISDITITINKEKEKGRRGLENLLNRVATHTNELFKEKWKEYASVKFDLRPDGKDIQCSIKEKNKFNFAQRSDGFKKFIGFLLSVSLSVENKDLENKLILIDEPESGLHPSGAKYLRDELIKISEKNYVVYSTHSISMIDQNEIGRHLIVNKKNEITEIEQAQEGNYHKEEVIFQALNYSIFEHIKPFNIILEGWTDRHLLEVATEKHEKVFFSKIGSVHGQGVKNLNQFAMNLELAERKAIIISDNDKPAKEKQNKYIEEHRKIEWKTYQDIDNSIKAETGEDFLKNSYIITKLKSISKSKEIDVFKDYTEGTLPNDRKLDYIKKELSIEVSKAKVKNEFMNEFKKSLFVEITKEDIDDSYFNFLDSLKEYIEKNYNIK